MKKFLFIFTIVITITFLLCACQNSQNLNNNSINHNLNETYVDEESAYLIFKPEKQVYSVDEDTIFFEVYNNTAKKRKCAWDGYVLEIKKGDKWEKLQYRKDVMIFTELLSVEVEPYESWKTELNLEELYYLPLEKGTYRIGEEENIGKVNYYSLEFEIK